MQGMKSAFLLLVVEVYLCAGFKTYQNQIPNGDLIPHPCKPNFLWQGVGHNNPSGGGSRNLFGADFEANGKVWDTCLCSADSDGDGRTNGEELGDPQCVWQPGDTPAENTGLSHPGVCEPIDSSDCLIRNVDLGDFCDAGDQINPCINETVLTLPDIQMVTLRFPVTAVPAQETTYMCQIFDVPSDQDYHAIAFSPAIDNVYVMHHILVYGCQDGTESQSTATECGMATDNCRNLLFAWAVGFNGQCTDENFGYRLGLTGFNTVMLQAHWNNPELLDSYTDSSGIAFYLTPNLRTYDGAMLMIGQRAIEIPESRSVVTVQGGCSSACTTVNIDTSIHVVESTIHMHYLGRAGYINHYRDGSKVTEMVSQDLYSYDVPLFQTYSSPVEVLPGDSFSVECQYKSSSRSEYTFYGDSTQQEMCFGFLVYYPAISTFTECILYSDTSVCPDVEFDMAGCDFSTFTESDAVYEDIVLSCDTTGAECYSGCQTKLDEYAAAHACMRNPGLAQTKEYLGGVGDTDSMAVVRAINSCLLPAEETSDTDTAGTQTQGLLCGATGLGGDVRGYVIILLGMFAMVLSN